MLGESVEKKKLAVGVELAITAEVEIKGARDAVGMGIASSRLGVTTLDKDAVGETDAT